MVAEYLSWLRYIRQSSNLLCESNSHNYSDIHHTQELQVMAVVIALFWYTIFVERYFDETFRFH